MLSRESCSEMTANEGQMVDSQKSKPEKSLFVTFLLVYNFMHIPFSFILCPVYFLCGVIDS